MVPEYLPSDFQKECLILKRTEYFAFYMLVNLILLGAWGLCSKHSPVQIQQQKH